MPPLNGSCLCRLLVTHFNNRDDLCHTHLTQVRWAPSAYKGDAPASINSEPPFQVPRNVNQFTLSSFGVSLDCITTDWYQGSPVEVQKKPYIGTSHVYESRQLSN